MVYPVLNKKFNICDEWGFYGPKKRSVRGLTVFKINKFDPHVLLQVITFIIGLQYKARFLENSRTRTKKKCYLLSHTVFSESSNCQVLVKHDQFYQLVE